MTNSIDIQSLLKTHVKPSALSGIEAVFQIILKDGESSHIIIADNDYTFHQTEHDDPTVTLTTDSDTLVGLIEGRVNSVQAFMMGKIKFSGDMGLAMKLKNIFNS